jgi:DNA polymerase/3'-5' exonuclease PolX
MLSALTLIRFKSLVEFYNDCIVEKKKRGEEWKPLTFKVKQFQKVVNKIESGVNFKNVEEAKKIGGFGVGTLSRVKEIEETGDLMELSGKITHEKSVKSELLRVTGIGPTKATKLFEANATLGELIAIVQKSSADSKGLLKMLTRPQIVGIRHFEDLKKRIPREIIREFESYARLISVEMFGEEIKTDICGSFRRHEENSGDIDLLVSHPSWNTDALCRVSMRAVVDRFFECGLLVDSLVGKPSTKFMGIFKLVNYAHVGRIDIRCVKYEDYVSCLLYFTGSKDENVRLRKIAASKGLKLNEYGLFNNNGTKLDLKKEEDFYSHLEEKYKHPEDR